jgi:hypothetical protein
MRYMFNALVGSLGELNLVRSRRRQDNKINVDPMEMRFRGMNSAQLPQDRIHWMGSCEDGSETLGLLSVANRGLEVRSCNIVKSLPYKIIYL